MTDISIRPITIDDFPAIVRWSMDDEFCLANGWDLNRDPDELYIWWRKCVEQQSSDFIRLGIDWKGRFIGYADLVLLDNNCAEFGIAIGESTLWGKGIGFRATKQLLHIAANTYGITTFIGETHKTNIRSRKMLEKLGFNEISRKGSELYKGKETQLIQYQLII